MWACNIPVADLLRKMVALACVIVEINVTAFPSQHACYPMVHPMWHVLVSVCWMFMFGLWSENLAGFNLIGKCEVPQPTLEQDHE